MASSSEKQGATNANSAIESTLATSRFKVSVHDESFSSEELLLNPEWFPGISVGAIVKLEFFRDDGQSVPTIGITQTSANSASVITSMSSGPQMAAGQSPSGVTTGTGASHQATASAGNPIEKGSVQQQINGRMVETLSENQTTAATTKSLVLRVVHISDIEGKTSKRIQISLLKGVAEAVGVAPWSSATVSQVDSKTGAYFVEFSFKDQFISRADILRFKSDVVGETTYIGKTFDLDGMRATTREIRINDGTVKTESSLLIESTRFIFRSRSTRIFWLIQMSSEMWELTGDDAGSLHIERLVDKFCAPLLKKWRELDVNHSLSIVLFTRLERYDYTRNNFHVSSHPGSPVAALPLQKATSYENAYSDLYDDLYRVALENEQASRLSEVALLAALKRELIAFGCSIGEFTREQALKYRTSDDFSEHPQITRSRILQDCDNPQPQIVSATEGNVLEAINLSLNVLDKHYMDRDLQRTGNSIVLLSASNGLFSVDSALAELTKQRMLDNGIGMDMVSLSVPPLHTAPIFMLRPTSPSGNTLKESMRGSGAGEQKTNFECPHWINLSFVDPECATEPKAWIAAAAPRRARRGWRVARLELDAPRRRRHDDDTGMHRSSGWNQGEGISPADCNASGGSLFNTNNKCRGRIKSDTYSNTINNRQRRRVPEALAYIIADNSRKLAEAQADDNSLRPDEETVPGATPISTPSNLPAEVVVSDTGSLNSLNKRSRQSTDSACVKSDHDLRLTAGRSGDDDNGQQSPGTPLRASVLIGSLSTRQYELPSRKWNDIGGNGAWTKNDTPPPSDPQNSQYLASSAAGSTGGYSNAGNNNLILRQGALREASRREARDDAPNIITGGKYNSTYAENFDAVSSVDSEDNNELLPYVPPPQNSQRTATAIPSPSEMISRDHFDYISCTGIQQTQESQIPEESTLIEKFKAHDENAFDANRPKMQHKSSQQSAPQHIQALTRRSTMTHISPTRINAKEPQPAYASSYTSRQSAGMPRKPMSRGVCASGSRCTMGANTTQTVRHFSDTYQSFQQSIQSGGGSNVPAHTSKSKEYTLLHAEVNGGKEDKANKSHKLSDIGSAVGAECIYEQPAGDTSKKTKFVNPFKRADEEEILQQRSHNRSRWSHVFPQGEEEFHTNWSGRVAGPNWKSLVTPAILPLEIDFKPPDFGTDKYTRDNHMHLVSKEQTHRIFEMVAQRIGGDYQIVSCEETKSIEESLASPGSNDLLYMLSMGHSVQKFTYEPEKDQLIVDIYRLKYNKKDPGNTIKYKYRLWLSAHDGYDHGEGRLDVYRGGSCDSATKPPRRNNGGTYIRREQTFYKYPSSETKWNALDEMICGGGIAPTYSFSSMKFRRILFVILPPPIDTKAAAADYHDRIKKFQRLLESQRASSASLDSKIRHSKISAASSVASDFESEDESKRCRSQAPSKSHLHIVRENSRWGEEWLALESDSEIDSARCWRFSIHWLLCSGWVVEEFLSSLSRKAKQYKLQLCQVPEYSLQIDIHPFLATATAIAASEPRLVALIKRTLVERMGFVLDSDTAMRPPEKLFQQYIHRLGTAFLRVYSNGHVVWIRNRLISPYASFRIKPLNPDAILLPLRCRAQALDRTIVYLDIFFIPLLKTNRHSPLTECRRLQHVFFCVADRITDFIYALPIDHKDTTINTIDDDSWTSTSANTATRHIPTRRSKIKPPIDGTATPSRSSAHQLADGYHEDTINLGTINSNVHLSSPPQAARPSSIESVHFNGSKNSISSASSVPNSSSTQQSASITLNSP